MKHRWTVLLYWTTLLAPLSLYAEQGDTQLWYQVELIVFEQSDRYGDEKMPRNITLQYPENRVELIVPGQQTTDSETALPEPTEELSDNMIGPVQEPSQYTEQPFLQLDPALRALTPDAAALNRNGNYRVLFHQAWRQPGENPRQAPWVLLRGGNLYGQHYELEGSIRLYRSRYLHVQTNLWFTRFVEGAGAQSAFSAHEGQHPETWPPLPVYPESPFNEEPETTEGKWATTIKPARVSEYAVDEIRVMKTARRIERVGELHYLDHPSMGALVLVTKYELPQPAVEELN